jgi:peroxiredoxin
MRFILSLAFCLVFGLTVFGQYSNKKQAEDFSATDLSGQNYSLNDFKGKVVLMTFWSTRCAICNEEIPSLNRLSQKFNGKDVVFLGLTMENETKVAPYLRKNPFNFRITPNSFGVLLKYADRDRDGNLNMGFPAYFLINQSGGIEYKGSGWDKTASLDSQISRLLNLK